MLKKDQCWRCDAAYTSACPKILCSECDVAHYCSSSCKNEDAFRHAVDCKAATLKRLSSGCGKEKAGLKPCGSCRQSWYCDKECLKKAWPTHKAYCRKETEDIKALSRALRSHLKAKEAMLGLATTYYWGNVPATDIINLPLNEGCEYSKPLSVLACGVGDPRNVALSVAQLPDSYRKEVTFVLNDICACTLARTVLLLYLLYKGGADVANSVTQIWYSLRLSEEDYRLVTDTLRDLTQVSSLEEVTGGIMSMNSEQFYRLVQVWRTWLDLSSRKGDWITIERCKMFESDPMANIGMDFYVAEIPKEHKKSASDWFQNGILIAKKARKTLPRENFTLSGASYFFANNMGTFTYLIQSSVIPFTSWDYKDARQYCRSPCLLEMYSLYIGHVLEKCAIKLATRKVKFQFLLCHCLNIHSFLPAEQKFDRVTTSNLGDYLPLPSLLDECKPLLNTANRYSVIVTEFLNWYINTTLKMEIYVQLKRMARSFFNKVLADTGSPAIACSSGVTGFVEYFDHTKHFIKFLRAALLISDLQSESAGRRSWKSLAEHNGLTARNFLRFENRIFRFRWPMNFRRVNILNGYEKAVEWTLL